MPLQRRPQIPFKRSGVVFRDAKPLALRDADVAALVDFINALTGTTIDRPPFGEPFAVASGLQLD